MNLSLNLFPKILFAVFAFILFGMHIGEASPPLIVKMLPDGSLQSKLDGQKISSDSGHLYADLMEVEIPTDISCAYFSKGLQDLSTIGPCTVILEYNGKKFPYAFPIADSYVKTPWFNLAIRATKDKRDFVTDPDLPGYAQINIQLVGKHFNSGTTNNLDQLRSLFSDAKSKFKVIGINISVLPDSNVSTIFEIAQLANDLSLPGYFISRATKSSNWPE